MEHKEDCHLKMCSELCGHKYDDCTCLPSPTISRAVVLEKIEQLRINRGTCMTKFPLEASVCTHVDCVANNKVLDAVIAFINEQK